jgi:hypothetical protein
MNTHIEWTELVTRKLSCSWRMIKRRVLYRWLNGCSTIQQFVQLRSCASVYRSARGRYRADDRRSWKLGRECLDGDCLPVPIRPFSRRRYDTNRHWLDRWRRYNPPCLPCLSISSLPLCGRERGIGKGHSRVDFAGVVDPSTIICQTNRPQRSVLVRKPVWPLYP